MVRGSIAGNFDVIHPGYIKMFRDCKKYCDYLIVFLHDDPSAERPEKCKPVLTVRERREVLMALEMVDKVVWYQTEADLYNLLKWYEPDVRFLGEDYIGKSFTGDDLPVRIHYLNRDHGWSTTKYKKLIAESINEKNTITLTGNFFSRLWNFQKTELRRLFKRTEERRDT
jgi:glycerol-3-phosphate cytidylyltransferase